MGNARYYLSAGGQRRRFTIAVTAGALLIIGAAGCSGNGPTAPSAASSASLAANPSVKIMFSAGLGLQASAGTLLLDGQLAATSTNGSIVSVTKTLPPGMHALSISSLSFGKLLVPTGQMTTIEFSAAAAGNSGGVQPGSVNGNYSITEQYAIEDGILTAAVVNACGVSVPSQWAFTIAGGSPLEIDFTVIRSQDMSAICPN